MNQPEQRRHPRVEKSFLVRYREQGRPQSEWMMSPLKDLSLSGARFLCERRFDVGTMVDMELVLPMVREPVPVAGRVVRAKDAMAGMVDHGVAFEGVDPAHEQVIGEAVEHFLKKQRRG